MQSEGGEQASATPMPIKYSGEQSAFLVQVTGQKNIFLVKHMNINIERNLKIVSVTLILANLTIDAGDLPDSCKQEITYAYNEGKNHADAPIWYKNMAEVTGVTIKDATFEDFQRYFKCTNLQAANCNEKGLGFPLTCSFPPCDKCYSKFKVFMPIV